MNDESWDYYLATGEDPTGGRIGPDFDPETGEYIKEEGTSTIKEVPGHISPIEKWIDEMIAKLDKLSK